MNKTAGIIGACRILAQHFVINLIQFKLNVINLDYEESISNIGIIWLQLWAYRILVPQQTPSFF